MRFLFSSLLALFLCWGTVRGQETTTFKAATLTLVSDTSSVEAGKPFNAGVHIQLDEGWDVYWQFVGEIGQATKIDWELPKGFTAGPLQWPLPEAHLAFGDMLNYVYLHEVLLYATITPPAQLPSGPITIKAHITWQMCDAQNCIPGDKQLALSLKSGPVQPANADLFAKWQALVPKAAAPPFKVKWDRSKEKEFSLQIDGLAKDTKAEFFPLPPDEVKAGDIGHPKLSEVAADGSRTITFSFDGAKQNIPSRGVIVAQKEGGPREGWIIAADGGTTATAPKNASGATSSAIDESAPKEGLIWKLFLAFIGGLIMNVMPCVLPVITLKIYGFVNQAGHAQGRVFRLGLAFNAGVFVFFLTLAGIMAKLRGSFSYGYQFQNPYLLAVIISLVFLFGLSLLGVFAFTLGGGAESTIGELSSKEGYGGAFLHGLFTTLLGTSCTAPFLGASLSYAVTQPVPVIFLIFTAIATGMCLPYFLLTLQPAWMRFLPKPGLWMERVKQIMGFIMLAITAWLFGIMGSHGAGAVAAMSWFLLILGFAAWLFGLHSSRLTMAAAILLPILGYWGLVHGKLDNNSEPTTNVGLEQKIAAARQAGSPVFIDFTADWCPNCKFFEKTVLKSDAIQAKFKEKNVVFFTADWTNIHDPEVTRMLKSYGAVGIPLYVLYRPGEEKPYVQESISKAGLLVELNKIKGSPAAGEKATAAASGK